jgi:hypothetical protein
LKTACEYVCLHRDYEKLMRIVQKNHKTGQG